MAIQINITPEMEKWSSAAAVDAARPVSDLPLACLNNGGAQRCVGGLIRAPDPRPAKPTPVMFLTSMTTPRLIPPRQLTVSDAVNGVGPGNDVGGFEEW